MAEVAAINPQASLLPLLRQAGVMIGLAAAVALGIYVVMWARTPEYAVLYTELTERDLTEVVDALAATDAPYRIDHRSGVILVAADQVHELRIQLASQGLPRSAGMGFEMLSEEQGFGTSQFREQARFQRAVEAELSRSIARINNVRSARVHLAVPRQSAFSRNQRDPTASVVVDLYNGRRLEDHQVGAIVHMVSASVPSMRPAGVTVIDQHGNLLSDGDGSGGELALTAKRFEYTRRLEQSYIDRVEAILLPMVGPGGVHAQVTAELDFTAIERTRESFNPDLPAVRSESIVEQERRGKDLGGVPGALSNEPPLDAEAPEVAGVAGDTAATDANGAEPSSRRSETTRNYELDRTIAHTRSAVGELRRLSVAVVVRNPRADGAAEEGAADGFDAAALARMEQLVREAIGFSAARGDSVSVTNVDFVEPEAPEPLPEAPMWEQPWLWSVVKQVLGGALVLFLVFGLIRPTVKSLLAKNEQAAAGVRSVELLPDGSDGARQDGAAVQAGAPQGLPQPLAQLGSPQTGPAIDGVKAFVEQDPKVATQVIQGWIENS